MSAEAAPTRDAGPFSRGTAILLVLVGVFAFSALVVLFSYAPDLRSADNGQPHALSRSALGYAGLVELLKFEGQPTAISRSRLPEARRQGLLVATPPPAADLAKIEQLNFGGPVLVVLPKWVAPPDPFHKGWVGKGEAIPVELTGEKSLLSTLKATRRKGEARPVLRGLDGPFAGASLPLGPVTTFQTIAAPGWTPLIDDETGAVVLARSPKGDVYVLSDPDLVNTHGLKSLETATAATAIVEGLKAGDAPVIFDVTLNGLARQRSVLRLLFDPPFLAVTLCLAAAAALAGFQAAWRFGPERRAGRVFALGKEALADNTAALIRLTRREHRMGAPYAELTRNIAARAVGAPRELSGAALTDFLDRMGRQRGARDSLSELTALAGAAPDRERLAQAAQRLFRWRLEMTRERQ
ncbi:MAG TPA: hypothetical protein VG939_12940 [Caulobacteraceae bacterium]|nr:hypothetical protein [Caulobacteraceae bacterium]